MAITRDPGTGQGQKVNDEGQASVIAVIQTELEHESVENGLAFAWRSAPYASSANDTILAVKNTSGDKTLHLECLKIANGAVATRYDIHIITDDYTGAGTIVTGVNLNTGKKNVAEAEAFADETGNAQGSIIETVYTKVDSNEPVNLTGIILAENQAIAIDVIEGSVTEVSVTIVGHYED